MDDNFLGKTIKTIVYNEDIPQLESLCYTRRDRKTLRRDFAAINDLCIEFGGYENIPDYALLITIKSPVLWSEIVLRLPMVLHGVPVPKIIPTDICKG